MIHDSKSLTRGASFGHTLTRSLRFGPRSLVVKHRVADLFAIEETIPPLNHQVDGFGHLCNPTLGHLLDRDDHLYFPCGELAFSALSDPKKNLHFAEV